MAAIRDAPNLKPVQETLQSGVVPESYIQPRDGYEVDDGHLPMMDDLTIDVSLLSSTEELTKLHTALSLWGCAQLVNHGMPSSLLDEIRDMSKQFFKLPQVEKDKYSSEENCLEGYGNDNVLREGTYNWNVKLHLQVYPFHKRQLQFWPKDPQNFRVTIHEYSIKTMVLLETLLKAMARSLDLEEDSFFELYGNDEDDMMHVRFNFFPQCPSSNKVVGLKPHGDGTVITILLQDKEVEGLRVMKDNQWFRVPIIPEALAIHVGDQMELVNHGIASEMLDEIQDMSKQFFRQPLEEKEKYSSKGDSLEGYGNDNTIRDGNFNWNDKLHLQVYPEHRRQLEFWPNNPQNFRKTLHEYTMKTKLVTEALFKAMSRSLKLEENQFFELWGDDKEDAIYARFNFYPRCPSSNKVVGLKPHTDGSAITILLQDKDVEGLRVMKDDQWFRVPIIPEALVIHVGDQLEIASNGIFKSPTHKVVINPQCDRISLAMLPLPQREKEIGPLKELITEERPQLYKRLKDYGQVYFQNMTSEERQINVVRINFLN